VSEKVKRDLSTVMGGSNITEQITHCRLQI